MKHRNQKVLPAEQRRRIRRRIGGGIAVIVALYVVIPMIFGDMGLVKYIQMRRTFDQTLRENLNLAEENRRLDAEVRAFRSDPDKIEETARERLGLVRPGERVYRFEPERP